MTKIHYLGWSWQCLIWSKSWLLSGSSGTRTFSTVLSLFFLHHIILVQTLPISKTMIIPKQCWPILSRPAIGNVIQAAPVLHSWCQSKSKGFLSHSSSWDQVKWVLPYQQSVETEKDILDKEKWEWYLRASESEPVKQWCLQEGSPVWSASGTSRLKLSFLFLVKTHVFLDWTL